MTEPSQPSRASELMGHNTANVEKLPRVEGQSASRWNRRVFLSASAAPIAATLLPGAVTNAQTSATPSAPAGVSTPVSGEKQAPTDPLVLQRRGSMIVGGESVAQTPTQLSFFADDADQAPGHVTINQMYVEYMVPVADNGVPIVMVHGATLSGMSYDTTPDGRMGWFEYFVRQGHPVYVPDQVSRARSGFDIASYNEVRAGEQPVSALPNYWRFTGELAWTQFRFGPTPGTAFPDEQFPVEAADAFSAQAIPDLNYGLSNPEANVMATNQLAAQVNGAVLLGHSQSGMLPVRAMLADPTNVKALIVIEPGNPNSAGFTDEQLAILATVPMLVVYGDHLDAETGTPVSWQAAYSDGQALVDRVNAAGGDAEMLHPPALGIRGNSHMIMMDKNNLDIADLILDWMERKVLSGGAATPVATVLKDASQ